MLPEALHVMRKRGEHDVVLLKRYVWAEGGGDLPHDETHQGAQGAEKLRAHHVHVLDIDHIGSESSDLFQDYLFALAVKAVFPGPGLLQRQAVDDQVCGAPPGQGHPFRIEVAVPEAFPLKRLLLIPVAGREQLGIPAVKILQERAVVGVEEDAGGLCLGLNLGLNLGALWGRGLMPGGIRC